LLIQLHLSKTRSITVKHAKPFLFYRWCNRACLHPPTPVPFRPASLPVIADRFLFPFTVGDWRLVPARDDAKCKCDDPRSRRRLSVYAKHDLLVAISHKPAVFMRLWCLLYQSIHRSTPNGSSKENVGVG